MKIITARWETTQEKLERIKYFKSKADLKTESSLIYCSNNLEKLSNDYNKFKDEYLIELENKAEQDYIDSFNRNNELKIYSKKCEDILNEIRNGITHKCVCGSKLRFIETYNFAGCVNFKDKSVKHTSINYPDWNRLNSFIPIKYDIEISKKHLEYFKKRYNLPDYIKLSILYNALKCNNVTILGDLDINFYNNGRNSALNSKNEEELLNRILNEKFKNINYQQGIKYKLDSDHIFKTKIPDYICINDNYIYVFDAKKSIENIDYSQLDLYHNLVGFIAKDKNINKQIKSYFIIFDPNFDSNDNRCLTVNSLKTI